jgi:hypothetical protein
MKRYVLLVVACLLATIAFAQHDYMSAESAPDKSAPPEEGMDHAMPAMSHRHLDMGPHMKMTTMRPLRAGDQQRADHIVKAARQVMHRYADYRDALADGFHIFMPNLPQKMYHFTKGWYAMEAAFGLNPEHPTSLLYEKTAGGGYKLIGVMYTAPANTSMEELDERIPLSIARWHEHTNFCAAPKGREREYFGPKAKFGLLGSISTEQECAAAGGKFRPQIFGWMVHVYPNETTQDAIWSVERQMEHRHGGQ